MLGAAVTVGTLALKTEDLQPAQSPSPTETTTSVAWDPDTAVADTIAGVSLPKCGEAFAPTPVSVDGVSAVPQALYYPAADGRVNSIGIVTNFQGEGGPNFMLGDSYSYVATKDGIVVAESLNFDALDVQGVGSEASSQATVTGRDTCAYQDEVAAAWRSIGLEPEEAENLTDEQEAALQPGLDAVKTQITDIAAQYDSLPSGEYQVYAVSPVIFGAQLAVGQEVRGLGVASLASLDSTLGDTALAVDPRIAPYCSAGGGSGLTCNPPPDVLLDVLTFKIDPASIVDQPSGVAISEPVTVTIP